MIRSFQWVLLLIAFVIQFEEVKAQSYHVRVLDAYTTTASLPCTTSVTLCTPSQKYAVRLYAFYNSTTLMNPTTFTGFIWQDSPDGITFTDISSSSATNPSLLIDAPSSGSRWYRFFNSSTSAFGGPFMVTLSSTANDVAITGYAGTGPSAPVTEQICDYTFNPGTGYDINPVLELRSISTSALSNYFWYNLDVIDPSYTFSSLNSTTLTTSSVVAHTSLINPVPTAPVTMYDDFSLIGYDNSPGCAVIDRIHVDPCNQPLAIDEITYAPINDRCDLSYTFPVPNVDYFHVEFKDVSDLSKTIHITLDGSEVGWGSFSGDRGQIAAYWVMSDPQEYGPLVAGDTYEVRVSAMMNNGQWYIPSNPYTTYQGYNPISSDPVYNPDLSLTNLENFGIQTPISLAGYPANPYVKNGAGQLIEGNFSFCEEVTLIGSNSTSSYVRFNDILHNLAVQTYVYDDPSDYLSIENIYYSAHIGDPPAVGCDAKGPWMHGIPDCCENYATDNSYAKWGSLSGGAVSVISGSKNWSNKILVSGTVTVPSGARLDITNVDVVFSTCDSKIVVEEGGTLECNNSTFRPCDENKAWGGIELAKNSISQFRECVFKNAAVAISATGSSDISISNNHFVNNQVAIQYQEITTPINGNNIEYTNSTFDKDISGNTIINEDNYIDWEACGYANGNNYTGISFNGVTFNGSISQNDFNAKFSGDASVNRFVGIQVLSGHTTNIISISANNFNNLINAIDIDNISGGSLSQNTFTNSVNFDSQTTITTTGDYLVRITNSTDLTIQDNELSSVVKTDLMSGFYLNHVQNTIIKSNNIKGLYNGISMIEGRYNNITDNTIDCEAGVGIWLDQSDFTDVGCNTIKMNYDYNIPARSPQSTDQLGIGIYLGNSDDLSSANTVKGNCVFDSRMSVAALGRVPEESNVFKNNFLYNYNEAGLYVDNYFTNIGSGSANYSDMGRNTFISNREDNIDATGLFDIFSPTITIDAYNNYGIRLVNHVQNFASNNYHSKASCGLQISELNHGEEDFISNRNTEDEYDYCNIDLGQAPQRSAYYLSEKGEFTLNANYLSSIGNANDGMTILRAVFTHDKANLSNVASSISGALSGDEQLMFNIEKSLLFGEVKDAYTYAMSAQTNNDYFNVKKIEVEYLKNNKSLKQMSAEEKVILNAVVAKKTSKAYSLAQGMLNFANNTHNYNYQSPSNIEITGSDRWLSMNAPHLMVYPNPSKDKISVEVVNPETNTARIEICNVTGQPIKTLNTNLTMGVISFDVSELSSGIYFVNLYGIDKSTPLKSKFIKN